MARLVDNGDGTVFDTKTNLTWQQTPPAAELTWKQAKSYASKEKLAGGGWRVPSIFELMSLISLTGRDKGLLEVYEDWFWSSTLCEGDPSYARVVFFDARIAHSDTGAAAPTTNNDFRVRCVR